ncbi:hypothetical protein CDAR_583691 [Caerostris darwini]|uniref:Uncharacterized protein n=1 Tax=Caerostris darwini TaxID=1538125 RepID=A0AAV4QUP1_9ARAC|nr:hypothetical protein CDAR_583691 [Caerostris darwini]
MNQPLWYTFGEQGYREQSQEAEGLPWRAGEEQSTYMFFGRTGRFKKAEISFSCRLFGDIVGSSAPGTYTPLSVEEAVAVATGSTDSSRASAVCREHFRHREKTKV